LEPLIRIKARNVPTNVPRAGRSGTMDGPWSVPG
jgi:hypothetical protein